MKITPNNSEIIRQLQQQILGWQGIKPATAHTVCMELGPVERAFPNGVFPVAGIHEFVCEGPEQTAAACGFISGLLAVLMRAGGVCLWISTSRMLFPPAIKAFGVEPDRIIFVDMQHEKDVLWATEETLKYNGLAVVVAELDRLDFIQSRRLQLAVEKSQVTGFVLRRNPVRMSTTACAARWQISPLPSMPEPGMPGIGLSRWKVELLKVRNGQPGSWVLEWSAGRFTSVEQEKEQADRRPELYQKQG